MSQVTRAGGSITFTFPDDLPDPSDIPVTKRRRGAAPTGAEAENFEIESLLKALTDVPQKTLQYQDFSVQDRFKMDLELDGRRRATRSEQQGHEVLAIDVDLAPNEGAVLLIEQDGTYEWYFPSVTGSRRSRRRRGRQPSAEKRVAEFRLPISPGGTPAPKRGARRGIGDSLTDYISGKIKGFVLKFVARKFVGALTRRLEKGVSPGPVIISSHSDATAWESADDYLGIALPGDRAARVLLMVHGTFSSTVGSFGALTSHAQGQAFLAAALSRYDAVIGFDHYTLAETPEENAEALYEQLRKMLDRAPGLTIDTISFSRGGLVYRYLTEQITPYETADMRFRKSIFVGCTNAGTELANDDNWKHLVNFYTNMVSGASRLLGMMPAAKLPATVFSQAIQSIGSLIKYMAQDAIENRNVPGLAAMEPRGKFVKALNKAPSGRTQPGATSYYAIGSDFEPVSGGSSGKLGQRLVLNIADGFIDQLMSEANDLVVDTNSMFIVDPVPSANLVDKLPFIQNSEIYHTVYFNQPEVSRQCARWLGLGPVRRKRAIGSPRNWWREAVTDDFSILPASSTLGDSLKLLKNDRSRFVVVERPCEGEFLHYGIPREILLDNIEHERDHKMSVLSLLDLHEYQSRSLAVTDALQADDASQLVALTESDRYSTVVLDEDQPVGVVASPLVLQPDSLEMSMREVTSARRGGRSAPPKRRPSARSRMRSSTRGPSRASVPLEEKAVPSTTEAEPVMPDTVWCNAHAVMPDTVVIGKTATVEVTLSRDEIVRQAGAAGGGGVDPDRGLIVQLQPRKHCTVVGESRAEVPVPLPGDEAQLYFDIKPRHEGVGQVDVIVRQGNMPISMLKLYPRFVEDLVQVEVDVTVAEDELVPSPVVNEMPDVLYIYESVMGQEQVLDFVLEARSLNKRERGTSQPFSDAHVRDEYIASLYESLEEFWADNEDDYDGFMTQLMARGCDIFDELMPENLRQILWDTRDTLKNIQVFSDNPYIPWELAYIKEPRKSATLDSYFMAEKGMVRWLPDSTRYPPRLLRWRDDMFRYVAPKYPTNSGYALPGAQEESRMLEAEYGATPINPTSKTVLKALGSPGSFDILHFACHGLADVRKIWDSALMMQGKMDQGEYQQDNLFSSVIEKFANLKDDDAPGPLVFLNACQIGRQGYRLTGTGGFAKAFAQAGAAAFIGTHWSVGDFPAQEFSRTFYAGLKQGKSLLEAVTEARKVARNRKEFTWLAYVVYADPYANMQQ